MSSVLGLQLQVALATHERLGVSLEPLCRGLSFSSADDVKGRRWVPWEEVATLMNRLPRQTDEEARAYARAYNRANPLIQVLGRLTTDLRVFLELYTSAAKAMAPHVTFEAEEDDETVTLRAELLPGLTPSSNYFEASAKHLEVMAESVGLPPVKVRSSTSSGAHMEVVFVAPRSTEGAGLARVELADALAMLESGLRGDRTQRAAANASEVLALQREFSLTRAEAKVALQIAAGRAPKECAASLGSSYETVRTHLRRVYAKLGVSSQRALTEHVERWRRRRAPRPSPRRRS